MSSNTGKLYTTTSLRNGGRRAGMGMDYDNYDDESYGGYHDQHLYGFEVRFPNDDVDPEELAGPVICYKEEK